MRSHLKIFSKKWVEKNAFKNSNRKINWNFIQVPYLYRHMKFEAFN